jgi:regulator of protease activity HflC (stomatin/prohibitin superfamily)
LYKSFVALHQAEEHEMKKVRWKRLLITIALGVVPITILFLFDAWWWATLVLLLTLFLACFAFPRRLYAPVFTLFSVLAIAWVSGSTIEGRLPVQWNLSQGERMAIVWGTGALLGILIPTVFWLATLFVSTRWILSVSDSFDIPWRQALKFVASRTFGTAQAYLVVENSEIIAENPPGILSRLGGPGVLVVRPGNAVVLERGGQTSRIVGPGAHELKPFETIKKPIAAKGIVDLRPQGASGTATDVLTKDGIPLDFEVGTGFQIEPQSKTDERPSSHYQGGEATTPVLGEPEYPVYEKTIHKAIFNTSPGGWKGMFPGGPIGILRDIVASFTLDQIFPRAPSADPNPDERTIKEIEDKVSERYDRSGSGVWFKGMDIKEVRVPPDVHERMLKRWTTPVDLGLKIEEAKTERDVMIERSKGRAESLERLEGVRLSARIKMVQVIEKLVNMLPEMNREQAVWAFVSVIHELTNRVGEDELSAMRYIEAMRAFLRGGGFRDLALPLPDSPPGMLSQPPRPQLSQGHKEQEENNEQTA